MANETIHLALTLDEAQVVLNALSDQPYRQVAALVPKILAQANTPAGEQQQAEVDPPDAADAAG